MTVDRAELTFSTEFHDARQAPAEGLIRRLIRVNKLWIGTMSFLILLMLVFTLLSPGIFLSPRIYLSVATTVPIAIFLAVPAVFLITAGEIDLSFPSVIAITGYVFSLTVAAGYGAGVGMLLAVGAGLGVGFLIGALVVYGKLSSLVATLGVSFMLRGLILVLTDGGSIPLLELREDTMRAIVVGPTLWSIPAQAWWALAFAFAAYILYTRTRFGIHAHHIGDNVESARAMGVNVNWTRCLLFAFMGVGAALAGVVSVMVNMTFWPTSGDGLLLIVLAAVFVGGTPAWGGIGTIAGGVIGTIIVTMMDVGVVAVGLSGFYTQLVSGIIIILALLGHRLQIARVR